MWLVILLMQLVIHIMYFSSNTHVSRIRKTFTNDLSATIWFSETQLFQMIQLGGLLASLLPLKVLDSVANLRR